MSTCPGRRLADAPADLERAGFSLKASAAWAKPAALKDAARRGATPPIPSQYVALVYAAVCAGCEVIFDVRHITCPNCAAAEFAPLETWIFSTRGGAR